MDQLLSQELMEEMMTLSLDQRCKKLNDKFGTKIHRKALSLLYRKHGISFLSTKYHFFLKDPKEQKLREQQDFVVKHLKHL